MTSVASGLAARLGRAVRRLIRLPRDLAARFLISVGERAAVESPYLLSVDRRLDEILLVVDTLVREISRLEAKIDAIENRSSDPDRID
ncbi:MAG: hypothetical protein SFX72_07975 [Isosphaeraceae bacterium]|nr:hypothetical protein [Isosphaeraceae bacterium]